MTLIHLKNGMTSWAETIYFSNAIWICKVTVIFSPFLLYFFFLMLNSQFLLLWEFQHVTPLSPQAYSPSTVISRYLVEKKVASFSRHPTLVLDFHHCIRNHYTHRDCTQCKCIPSQFSGVWSLGSLGLESRCPVGLQSTWGSSKPTQTSRRLTGED